MTKFKALFSLAVAALLCSAPARADMIPGVAVTPVGYCQIAAATLAAATPLSSCSGGIPAGANLALLQAETQNIRWRDDGTAPTTTVGMILIQGAHQPTLYAGTLSKLQFIDATAGGILNVTFYRAAAP